MTYLRQNFLPHSCRGEEILISVVWFKHRYPERRNTYPEMCETYFAVIQCRTPEKISEN
jgi:hypothetical protein